jgi:serine/threonine protein kinase
MSESSPLLDLPIELVEIIVAQAINETDDRSKWKTLIGLRRSCKTLHRICKATPVSMKTTDVIQTYLLKKMFPSYTITASYKPHTPIRAIDGSQIEFGRCGNSTLCAVSFARQDGICRKFDPSTLPIEIQREVEIMIQLQLIQLDIYHGIRLSVPVLWNDHESYVTKRHRGTFETQVGSLPTRTVFFVVKQVARLLSIAHMQGIVHHNLTPAAILLGEHRTIVLGDWGLASVVSTDKRFNDDIGMPFRGPYGFTAPEQLKGERGNPASDIYSLGKCALAFAMSKDDPFIKRFHDELANENLACRPNALEILTMVERYLRSTAPPGINFSQQFNWMPHAQRQEDELWDNLGELDALAEMNCIGYTFLRKRDS